MTAGTGYSGDSYSRSTTVGIETLDVNGFDLRDFLIKFTMYEDVFAHTTTIEVLVQDQGGITEDPGIFTGETLQVAFKSHREGGFETISKTFKVYKVEVLTAGRAGSKNRMLVLHGTTDAAFTNIEKRMSRAYIDLTEDQIVSDVCTNVLGLSNVETEPAKYARRFVIPNWRPFTVIQEMCRSAIRGSGYEAGTFLFFEGRDNHKFITLDKMIEEAASKDVTVKIAKAFKPEEYARLNAKSYTQDIAADYFRNADKGMFGTRFLGVNVSEKDYKHYDYIYGGEFGAQTKIDGNNEKLTPNDPSFEEQKLICGAMEKYPTGDHSSHFADKRAFKRSGMIQQYHNYEFMVDVDGDTSLPFPCVVNFELPSVDSRGDSFPTITQEEDKYLSGNYLVAHIAHEVNSAEHRMKLGLIKPQLLSG